MKHVVHTQVLRSNRPFRLSDPVLMRLFGLSGASSCGSISPRDGTMDPEQLTVSLGRGEVSQTFSHQAACVGPSLMVGMRTHLGRLYTCLSAKVELVDLSLKLVKPCAHSFVDISSNRARRDRNSDKFDSDRPWSYFLRTRKFSWFWPPWSLFEN